MTARAHEGDNSDELLNLQSSGERSALCRRLYRAAEPVRRNRVGRRPETLQAGHSKAGSSSEENYLNILILEMIITTAMMLALRLLPKRFARREPQAGHINRRISDPDGY